MAGRSKIEWCDATAQVASGCDPISEGCRHCYSAHLAGTRLKHLPRTEGLTRRTAEGRFVFNGTVRFHDDQVEKMLTWRAPKNLGRRPRVFVADRSDLFHDAITDAQRDKVFAVIALRPDVDYLLLTKRSARMWEYLSDPRRPRQIARAVIDLFVDGKLPKSYTIGDDWPVESLGENIDFPTDVTLKMWPLPNVSLGVSIEDQPRAEERIPDLLATPAAVRFISAEPLLGGIRLDRVGLSVDDFKDCGGHPDPAWPLDTQDATWLNALRGRMEAEAQTLGGVRRGDISVDLAWLGGKINWVIVGGESGRGARPMHPDWVRALRDQCAAAGVPFFFKQWGEWGPVAVSADGTYEYDSEVRLVSPAGRSVDHADIDRCDFPDNSLLMERRGKARAGRLLDGVEHNGMPEVRHG